MKLPCAFLLLITAVLCRGAVLTINQVAQHAYNAGFRGGSLVSAIAAAEAESGFDPDVVGNNLHLMDAQGNLLYTNGQPRIACLPRTGQVKLPLNSTQTMPGGQQGKVVSWCRGLWQFNSVVFPNKPTDAQAFDPAQAAACSWIISRHGRDWGKWRVMRSGTAFQADRLTRARNAARAIDLSVIPISPAAGLRVEARVTGGNIRSTPAGAILRTLHRHDSGVLISSPVQAALVQGSQTSIKIWRQVQWDTGETGWASEDLLVVSTINVRRGASPVFDGVPDRAFHIDRRPLLRWTIGGNTIEHRLYIGTGATLTAADLKWTGRSDRWQANYNLPWGTRHWWRVDSRGYDGVWAAGPVATFCTELPPAGYVVIQSLNAEPVYAQAGWPVTISGTAFCDAVQPVLIGASLVSNSGVVLSDTPNDAPVTLNGTTAFSRRFQIPLNTAQETWTVRVALWQDADRNGLINAADRMLAQANDYILVIAPGPRTGTPTVTPATAPPGTQLTISVPAEALPGSLVTWGKLYRAEGNAPPHPLDWVQIVPPDAPLIENGRVIFKDVPPSIRRYWYAIQAQDFQNRLGPPSVVYLQPVSALITLNDRTPPVINWTFPAADGQSVTGFQSPSGTATDNDQVELITASLDGGPFEFAGFGGFWSVNSGASQGTHTITVRAVDRSGNVSTVTRLYYVAGDPLQFPPPFDAGVNFTGNTVPAFWSVNGGTLTGDRLTAAGDFETGELMAFQKAQPEGSAGVETGFLCGPEGGGVKWSRQFGSGPGAKVVRSSATQWQLETTENFTPRITPLTVPGGVAPASFTVFTIFTEGRLYCRVGRGSAPYEIFGQTEWTSPGLAGTGLRDCVFTVQGSNRGVSWLDNIEVRALPGGTAAWLDTRAFRRAAPGSAQWDAEWVSFPGRQYRMEYQSGSAWLQAGGIFSATSLISANRVTLPAGNRSIFRVRQVVP